MANKGIYFVVFVSALIIISQVTASVSPAPAQARTSSFPVQPSFRRPGTLTRSLTPSRQSSLSNRDVAIEDDAYRNGETAVNPAVSGLQSQDANRKWATLKLKFEETGNNKVTQAFIERLMNHFIGIMRDQNAGAIIQNVFYYAHIVLTSPVGAENVAQIANFLGDLMTDPDSARTIYGLCNLLVKIGTNQVQAQKLIRATFDAVEDVVSTPHVDDAIAALMLGLRNIVNNMNSETVKAGWARLRKYNRVMFNNPDLPVSEENGGYSSGSDSEYATRELTFGVDGQVADTSTEVLDELFPLSSTTDAIRDFDNHNLNKELEKKIGENLKPNAIEQRTSDLISNAVDSAKLGDREPTLVK